jgi:acetyl esterase/lipase
MAPVLNLLISHAGYSVKEDLAYGGNPRQKLDVYTPDHLTGKAPVILFFYGGSWQSGKKEQYLAFGESFATKGIVVAVADYRVYPEVRYPDFLKDGAAAVAYVHAHIAEYGGDPDRIFIAGHSAGAYIAVTLAADPHYLDDAGAKLSWVHGVIGIAGPYDFLPLTDPTIITIFGGAHRTDTQPITYIDGKRPPMLLAAGDADQTVSPGNTTRMAAKLQSFGSPVEVHIYPGISHVGIILSLAPMLRGNTTLRQDIINFVNTN